MLSVAELAREATSAWITFSGAASSPKAQILKRAVKSSVVRLEDTLLPGGSIVAKRRDLRSLEQERRIYQDLLPSMSVTSLRCYGIEQVPGAAAGWLFLESADGEPYSANDPAHAGLAARWLASLHRGGVNPDELAAWLPTRTDEDYRRQLESGTARFRQALATDRALPASVSRSASRLIYLADDLLADWSSVSSRATSMPMAVVHGDFVGKNIRVASCGDCAALLVFDWEHACWGPPAVDLAQMLPGGPDFAAGPDLLGYASRMPGGDSIDVATLSVLGTLLRLCAAVEWASAHLDSSRPERAWVNIPTYEAGLDLVTRRLR